MTRWPYVLALAVALTYGAYAFAGAVYTNDTGFIAYGFRVAFLSPVEITGHSQALLLQSPRGEASEFYFSGGQILPGSTYWLSWLSSEVAVAEFEWILAQEPERLACESAEISATLFSVEGAEVGGVIERSIEMHHLPFHVSYELKSLSVPLEVVHAEWSVSEPSCGTHFRSYPIESEASETGLTFSITFFSSRPKYEIELTVTDEKGVEYTWHDVVEIRLNVGDQILLVPEDDAKDISWKQVFEERNSMLYVTHQTCPMKTRFGDTVIEPRWPGNYHFRGEDAKGRAIEVEAYVHFVPSRAIPIRGVFFADYYGLNPPEGRNITETVISEAVDYVQSLNANLVAINNFCGLMQISPYPLLRIDIGGASISGEMLRSLVLTSKERGLRFYLSMAQFDQFPYLTEAEKQEIWKPEGKSRSWYERFFYEIRRFVNYNARITQGLGIDFVTPKEHAGPLYTGQAFETYRLNALCQNLVAHMKKVFDASEGWADPHPGHSNRFLRDCDFIVIRLWPMEIFNVHTFINSSNPTISQIEDAALSYLNKIHAYLPSDVPVFVHISALSEDKQNDFVYREPFPRERMDLQEQVDYLEGFLRAAYKTPWVQGILAWNVNWFPEWALPEWETTYSNWNFRGKPAEEVVRLWYECLEMAK